MAGDQKDRQTKILYIGILLVLVAISLYVIFPFLSSIVGGFVLAYLFYPVYKKLLEKTGRKTISALIVLFIVLIVIIVPAAFMANIMAKETFTLYVFAKQKFVGGSIFDINCDADQYKANPVCAFNKYTQGVFRDPQTSFYIESGLGKITQYVLDKTTNFLISLPKLLLSMFIALFIMYYLWKDWDLLVKKFHKVLHLRKHHEIFVSKKVKDIAYAVIYGNLIIALFQGAVGAIGFFVFGVNSPIIWGIVMGFLSLLHFVGTPLIWIPASLSLLIEGLVQTNNNLIFRGIGLFLYGAIVISTIDNFLRPKIIGSRADIHPILVILGIFGGVAVFGLVGIVLGPIILGLTSVFIEIYEEELRDHS